MSVAKNREFDMLSKGQILEAYGKEYLLTINPVPSIAMVRWSLVKIGSGGKEHADFWMDWEDMRQLVIEIKSGIFSQKIAADVKNQYPKAYEYVSGEKGQKKLNIGAGRCGVRVQIIEPKNNRIVNMMSPITAKGVNSFSFLFQLISGLIPLQDGSYYDSLYKCFWIHDKQRMALRNHLTQAQN